MKNLKQRNLMKKELKQMLRQKRKRNDIFDEI